MKPKIRFLLLAVIFTITLAACAPQINVDSLEKSEYGDLADSGITMNIKNETVTTKTESLKIEYANATDTEYVFGKEPHLEIASDDEWYVVPINESAAWEAIGIILPPNGTSEDDFSLGFYYEGLLPGHYRIIKTFYGDGGSVAAAEFDIADSDG